MFDWSFGRELSLPLGAGILGCIVLGLVLSALSVPRGRPRLVSILLRSMVWTAVLLIFLRASLLHVEREMIRRPLAVLVDQSASMTLPIDAKRNRWEVIREWLDAESFWSDLGRDFDVYFYSFSDALSQTSRESLQATPAPAGNRTELLSSLREFNDGKPWAGVILVTDGVDTETDSLEKDAKGLGLPFPVVGVVPPSEQGLRDAAVVSVRTPELAYYKNSVTIEIDVDVVGLPKNGVSVRATSGEQTLARVEIGPKDWQENRATVLLSFVAQTLGPTPIKIEIPRYPNEATYDNNQAWTVTRVLRDRVRVLHVAGRPSWDVRFLREYLKEERNIDLISFFILRSPSDDPEALQNALSLIPFPYSDLFTKELANFDLVIFQNFDFRTYFSPYYLGRIRQYVEEGGAFALIGGDLSFGKGNYRGTPLEEVLPILIRDDAEEISTAPFRPQLTTKGSNHPIVEGFFDAQDLAGMPAFWGFHQTLDLQSGAVVLLEHPTVRSGSHQAPVLATREVGRGRTIAVTVDSLWRWMFRGGARGPRMYRQLWRGMYRWLVRDPSFAYMKLDLPTDVAGGTTMEIVATVMGKDYAPLAGQRPTLQGRQGTEIQKHLFPPTDKQGTSRLTVVAPESGVWELTGFIPDREEHGYSVREAVSLRTKAREFIQRSVNRRGIELLTAQTGGIVISPQNRNVRAFKPFYREARYRRVGTAETPIWDQPLLLLFLLAAISFEWWYRRRNGAL